jgi:phage terminase large subunit GpA-like protein
VSHDRQYFRLRRADHGPWGTFLYAHPTDNNARRWSRMKLSPMMRATPIVAEQFPQRARDGADNVLFKERRDGLSRLLITGANSPASLSQITVDCSIA